MFSQRLQADWDNAKPRIEKERESIMASQKPVALVTGASSGIGQATAELLAAHGFTVFGTSRTPAQDKRSYTWLPLDVRSEDSVQAAVQSLLAQAGRIDLLVNNAGYVQFGAIEESSVADAQAQLDTNPFAAYTNARQAAQQSLITNGKKGMEPGAVARVILRAATTRPRLRYPVGQDGKVVLLLKRLLPASAFEALKRRLFSA